MKCRHCGSELRLPLVDLGSAPPSNAYLTEQILHAPVSIYERATGQRVIRLVSPWCSVNWQRFRQPGTKCSPWTAPVAALPLHAADSLQLTAALFACEHRPQAWQFVCMDARLSLAAEREGFGVVRKFTARANGDFLHQI